MADKARRMLLSSPSPQEAKDNFSGVLRTAYSPGIRLIVF